MKKMVYVGNMRDSRNVICQNPAKWTLRS